MGKPVKIVKSRKKDRVTRSFCISEENLEKLDQWKAATSLNRSAILNIVLESVNKFPGIKATN